MTEPKPSIGVLDSGVGGLSVLLELRKELPHHLFEYVADSAWCPYGSKSAEQLRQRTHAVAGFLIQRGATTIILACNSATIHAISSLRESYPNVKFVGLEPALKPASSRTKNGKIAVLATTATLTGHKFHKLVDQWITPAGHILLTKDCPKFVELVERGITQGAEVNAAIIEYLAPIVRQAPDTLVLGCSHYPFLISSLRNYLPNHINILDTGSAVAQHTASLLSLESSRPNSDTLDSQTIVHSTGNTELHSTLIPQLCAIRDLQIRTTVI